MTPRDLQAQIKRVPFEPFIIVMDNGQRFEVPHPDCAMVTSTSVVVAGKPRRGVPEGPAYTCAIRNISVLEPLAPTS